jgi:nucleoside phosphorylase
LSDDWRKFINVEPPNKCTPKVVTGEIASGDKVVDDPTNVFFSEVRRAWSKTRAVEMEGAGVGLAIEQAHAKGIKIGFMMIRGISDLPRSKNIDKIRGSAERENWKQFAAHTAAAFTLGFVASGLPIPPRH